MTVFNPSAYGPLVKELLTPERLPELGPGNPNLAAKPKLEALTIGMLFADGVSDADLARCCIAALWLWHDFLNEAHKIVQDIDTPEGSYWHGIMHRREGDYSNAKYWFRRVGAHPVCRSLQQEFTGEQGPAWDYDRFVNDCASSYGTGLEDEDYCQWLQRLEWQLLFDWCWQHATR